MKSIKAIFTRWNVKNTWIILRADLNVTLHEQKPLNDGRLRALLPTLTSLRAQGARLIILSHIGRPLARENTLSTKHLIPWFEKHLNFSLHHASSIEELTTLQKTDADSILFENTRFFAFEKEHNHPDLIRLAQCASFFINDAFGTLHRTDPTITQLPLLFPFSARSIGLLVEKELSILTPLRDHPQSPALLIVGGGKPSTKLPLVTHFVDKVEYIALLPLLSQMHSENSSDGLTDERLKLLHNKLKKSTTKIIYPQDYLIEKGTRLEIITAEVLQPTDRVISIGPRSVAALAPVIQKAHTIIGNGLSGFLERPETLEPVHALLTLIAQSNAYSVMAGGDTMSILEHFGLEQAVSYVSTGGGATLAYLAAEELPGLMPFIHS